MQNEIAATLKDRPQRADIIYFVGKVVKNAANEEYRLTQKDSESINKHLYKHDIIDDENKIIALEPIEKYEIQLPENLKQYIASICDILKSKQPEWRSRRYLISQP